jgi:hypothetical protein
MSSDKKLTIVGAITETGNESIFIGDKILGQGKI